LTIWIANGSATSVVRGIQPERRRLDLERAPGAVAKLDHGIDLEAGSVVVVADLRVQRLRVDAQVTHDEGLEEQPEGVDLAGQKICSRPLV